MTAPAILNTKCTGNAVTISTVAPNGRRGKCTLAFGRDESDAYDALGAIIILAEIGKGVELDEVERRALHTIVSRLRGRAARD